MEIKLYNTVSNTNKINKILTDENIIQIKLKNSTSKLNPIVILEVPNDFDFNYVYIPDFKRYYFVDSVDRFNNKIINMSLSIDVLMSYKTEILNGHGWVVVGKNIDPYFNANAPTLDSVEITKFLSDGKVDLHDTNIMITKGGFVNDN